MKKFSFIKKFSRIIILVIIFIFFSLTTETFWSPNEWSNLANIVLQQFPFSMLLALSMTLSMILKGFDLSIGASVALISCVAGIVLNKTYCSLLTIIFSLLLALLIGLTNGLLITKIGVSSFISTYSLKWILGGVALVLLGGKQIFDLGPTYRNIFITYKFTFLLIAISVGAIVSFILNKTIIGRQIYYTGHNIEAAKISGINTDKTTILVYLISGFIIGLVALMYLANLGTAEPNIGDNFAINAIAASLVGGTSIEGGYGGVSNAIIGSLILLFLSNGMIQIGVPSVWQQVIVGVVIILSIVMQRLLDNIR